MLSSLNAQSFRYQSLAAALLGFDIYVVDFILARPNQKALAQIRR